MTFQDEYQTIPDESGRIQTWPKLNPRQTVEKKLEKGFSKSSRTRFTTMLVTVHATERASFAKRDWSYPCFSTR